MYIKLFTNGLAVISLITAGCISSCNAAHGHKHGDVLGRIMHKPIARSGSSFNVTTIAAADGRDNKRANSQDLVN